MTGTFAGVAPVRSVDGRTIGSGDRGPVVTRLQGLYADWVAADVASHVGGGTSVDLRMSATFVLEGASWRLVHLHTSSPSPDDPEVIGAELSATMERILDSVGGDSCTSVTNAASARAASITRSTSPAPTSSLGWVVTARLPMPTDAGSS